MFFWRVNALNTQFQSPRGVVDSCSPHLLNFRLAQFISQCFRNLTVNSALPWSTSLHVHVMMNRKPFYSNHSLLPSSSLCLMSTWLHVFMGLYLPPLRIIALRALGVNSLRSIQSDTNTKLQHDTGYLQGNFKGTICYNHHILSSHEAKSPPTSAPHIRVMTDWLMLWIHGCLMTPDKNIGVMRDK